MGQWLGAGDLWVGGWREQAREAAEVVMRAARRAVRAKRPGAHEKSPARAGDVAWIAGGFKKAGEGA